MEFLQTLLGAMLGGLDAYLAARRKFRDELHVAYDQSLRTVRIPAYEVLWNLTGALPKYAKTEAVDGSRLEQLAVELCDWYFAGGGMFLTDKSRDAYFDVQKAIEAQCATDSTKAGAPLESTAYDKLRKQCSTLRSSLCTDLRSRMQPAFTGPEAAPEF